MGVEKSLLLLWVQRKLATHEEQMSIRGRKMRSMKAIHLSTRWKNALASAFAVHTINRGKNRLNWIIVVQETGLVSPSALVLYQHEGFTDILSSDTGPQIETRDKDQTVRVSYQKCPSKTRATKHKIGFKVNEPPNPKVTPMATALHV